LPARAIAAPCPDGQRPVKLTVSPAQGSGVQAPTVHRRLLENLDAALRHDRSGLRVTLRPERGILRLVHRHVLGQPLRHEVIPLRVVHAALLLGVAVLRLGAELGPTAGG